MSPTNRRTAIAWGMLTLLSIAVAVISLRYFLAPDKAPLLALKSGLFRVSLLVHAGAGIVALLTGPFQFSGRLRARALRLHRSLGYFYFLAVLIGGVAGIVSSKDAAGGFQPKFAFFILAVLWLATGARALAAIRRRDIPSHRDWMIRNFALTFAAVTLRIQLPVFEFLSGSFEEAYRVVAWFAWVPNLAFAEWLIRRRPPAARS